MDVFVPQREGIATKCTCTYTTGVDPAVRKGFEMSGSLKSECEACKERRALAPAKVVGDEALVAKGPASISEFGDFFATRHTGVVVIGANDRKFSGKVEVNVVKEGTKRQLEPPLLLDYSSAIAKVQSALGRRLTASELERCSDTDVIVVQV